MKKKLISIMAVGAAVFGMFVFQIPAAESASAHNRVCRVVTVPASLPWYQCLGNTFTPGTNNNPPGCYPSKKTVCS